MSQAFLYQVRLVTVVFVITSAKEGKIYDKKIRKHRAIIKRKQFSTGKSVDCGIVPFCL